VATHFQEKGITNFLPLIASVRRWSDRRKVVQLPLFPCYTFVRLDHSAAQRLSMFRTPGVVRLVGVRQEGVPIPDKQIEDVRQILVQSIACAPHPFLKVAQRVRVRGGCLDGIEGLLLACYPSRTLIVSVEPIQRSLAICVEHYDVEPI